MLLVLTLASSLAFLAYGAACLASESMRREFERFGLEPFRRLTGWLEVLGGAGLLVGFKWPVIVWVSSGGLCLLMLLALGVRLWNRDGFLLSIPAAVLMIVNAAILKKSLGL
ncbi:MAG: DoxX family protein [Vicinamibacteria bacterium]